MNNKIDTTQQLLLMGGIFKLCETYRVLKKLNFSYCVLNQIEDIVDDLMGLVENEVIKNHLLSLEVRYNKENNKYLIND